MGRHDARADHRTRRRIEDLRRRARAPPRDASYRRRRISRRCRPVGLGQDDALAPDQPARRAHQRPCPRPKRRRAACRSAGAAAPHRLRLPGHRPVPAPHRRRERRDHAAPDRLEPGEAGGARRRTLATRAARSRAISRPLSGGPFRRRAPARRRRPRARGRAEDRADGRALRRARRAEPRRHRPRLSRAARESRADQRNDHARSDRGGVARRPRRGRSPRPRDRGRHAAAIDDRAQARLCARIDRDAAPAGGAPRRAAEGRRRMSGLDPRIYDALARLPDYLGSHVLVSVSALALGLVSIRRPFLRNTLLAFVSTVQTIPGLALLALFYPLLLGLSALTAKLFGAGFSALGFLPAVLALALYSMLPVVRNTVTGILGIDPAVNEAALGVGMTRRQALTMVELPLALPVIMAGIRTSAVWVIGTATLATPVGQTSLGNYIFTGLQTQNWIFVLFGCVAAAVLALAVDQLLSLMESGLSGRKRNRVALGALGLALVVGGALVPNLSRPQAAY